MSMHGDGIKAIMKETAELDTVLWETTSTRVYHRGMRDSGGPRVCEAMGVGRLGKMGYGFIDIIVSGAYILCCEYVIEVCMYV